MMESGREKKNKKVGDLCKSMTNQGFTVVSLVGRAFCFVQNIKYEQKVTKQIIQIQQQSVFHIS